VIREAFLVCAMALPPASIQHPACNCTAEIFMKEYREIRNLLESIHPHCEYLIVGGIHLIPKGFRHIPMSWRGQSIYYRPMNEKLRQAA